MSAASAGDGLEALDISALLRALLALEPGAEAELTLPPLPPLHMAQVLSNEIPCAQWLVLGPTQVGKSTLVNALLGGTYAGVSATAAYTVDAHGFALQGGRAPAGVAERDGDTFTTVEGEWAQGAAVLWDAPDFDSLRAKDYIETVAQLAGAASAVMMVVSQEKYADASAWQWLAWLRDWGVPCALVVNKLGPGVEDEVMGLLDTYQAEHGIAVPVFGLPWSAGSLATLDTVQSLRDWLSTQRQPVRTAPAVWQQQWQALSTALHQREQGWIEAVDAAVAQHLDAELAVLAGRARHPLQEAMLLRLMELLELPYIAAITRRLRRVLTAPWRWALQRGGSVPEHAAFALLAEHVIDTLAHSASAQDDAYTRALRATLRARRTELAALAPLASFAEQMESEVAASADRVYAQVQDNPLLLNGLRTVRFGMDLGAVFAAFKLGGALLVEAALAPAMLSLSSKLAESAVGEVVRREERYLLQRQAEAARKELGQGEWVVLLRALPTTLSSQHFARLS